MKNKGAITKILGLSSLLIGACCLTACQVQSDVEIQVTPVEVPTQLSALLLQQKDFSSDWEWWVSDDTSNGEKTPNLIEDATSNTNSVVDSATQAFAGFYSNREYYVQFGHIIKEWDELVSLQTVNQELEQSTDALGPKLPTQFIAVGQFMKSRCTETDNSLRICEVVVGYDNITSHLKVYATGHTPMDTQTLEMIINEALTGIDNRVSEYWTER